MALQTSEDIKAEFIVRGQQNTASGFLNDTILNDWVQEKHRWSASYKKWPFTEGRVSTTYASALTTDEDGNLRGEYPEGWKPDSIRLMKIGGKWITKMNFQAFHRWREDQPDANGVESRQFTDYGRLYYLSPNIDISGTIVLWGQFTPADLDVTGGNTIFSNVDEDGNEAIVEAMLGELEMRKLDQRAAQGHMAKAAALLNGLWDKIVQEQPQYRNNDTGMFEHFDVLQGGYPEHLVNPRRWLN